jgi:lipopolysaccharide/colanic/teichoic acid biosynthesis glycosyltransferase
LNRWLELRWKSDRVLAALLLVVTAPVLLLLGVLVVCGSRGPALIRLARVGRGGRRFLMWKLRSMRTGSSGSRVDGPALTAPDDPRITALGRFLRRYRLDELPQLVNVVMGEMALIGPRPETPEYVDAADQRWARVLSAKPGIAGPSQVAVYRWEPQVLASGAANAYTGAILPVKLAIDSWYLQQASPWVDILVVVSLLQAFVGRRQVTVLQSRLARDVAEARVICAGA